MNFEKAKDVCKVLGVFTAKVGVFVDAELEYVLDIASSLRLSAVQLHGQESEVYILKIKKHFPVVKAINIKANTEFKILQNLVTDAILVDGSMPGSGKTFEWPKAELLQQVPNLILAGGLTPENVSKGIEFFKPYGVDVSSGVESSYGIKDPKKMLDFILNAKKESYPQACG